MVGSICSGSHRTMAGRIRRLVGQAREQCILRESGNRRGRALGCGDGLLGETGEEGRRRWGIGAEHGTAGRELCGVGGESWGVGDG